MRHTALALFSASLLLAACGSGEDNSLYAPSPDDADETAMSGPVAAPDDDLADQQETRFNESGDTFDIAAALEEPPADGEWFAQPTWAGFGPPASEPTFRLECSEYGMIEMTRMMDTDPTKPLRGMVAAGEEAQDGYWTAEDGTELPAAHFEVYAEAPIFDAMMEADRFVLLAEDRQPLVVPGDRALNQQIETCRDRGSGTP